MERPPLEYLARLARLKLDPAEAESLATDLDRLLTHFQTLAEVDTTDIEPSPFPLELGDCWREDQETPGLSPDSALANAPEKQDGYFRVPPILGQGEED